MPGTQTFVIVGAGLAGAKAAETLREEGFEGLRANLLINGAFRARLRRQRATPDAPHRRWDLRMRPHLGRPQMSATAVSRARRALARGRRVSVLLGAVALDRAGNRTRVLRRIAVRR